MASGDALVEQYHELCAYTLLRGDPEFIHQHVVDAWMAQTADESTKPIGLTFALVGVHLLVERGFTGRAVQRAHMMLAREKRAWPRFPLPSSRGAMTVADVIAAPEGAERDRAIHAWAASVWQAYRESHGAVEALLREFSERLAACSE
jgi:hypothetical protein